MDWKTKALIMRVCAAIPGGHSLYTLLQKRFGNLNDDPWSRVAVQEEMARWLLDAGITIPGKVFFEVGTGHKPIIPICFSLMGAEKIYTADLNRRLDLKLVKGVLRHLLHKRETLIGRWKSFIPEDLLNQRFDMLLHFGSEPERFLQEAGVIYLAPVDARSTQLSDEVIDCHISNTVMEHIEPEILSKIVREACRLLKKDGVALHFIDLSDHFQHQDSSISAINFLKYTDQEWNRIAGNEYAYTNRLRVPDYLAIFNEFPFTVLRKEVQSEGDMEQDHDVRLDSSFCAYTRDDVDVTDLRLLLQKEKSEGKAAV